MMSADPQSFADSFCCLTGYAPMRWQRRLFRQLMHGKFPGSLDLPTGLGKTSVMAIWLLTRAFATAEVRVAIPRRLVYVVDRRAVVDQATEEADKLRDALDCNDTPVSKAEHLKRLKPGDKERAFETLRALKKRLLGGREKLPVSTLRGAHVDNREWLEDPAAPAIIVGTVDMIGSRLLFEGYGVSRKMRPYHAGLLGVDSLVILDEAHLVPPFADLLAAVEGDAPFWPKDRAPLPPMVVLPLSATQRERVSADSGRKPFGLDNEDRSDETASARLNAAKHLRIEPLAEKGHDRQLADAAFELATKDGPARVVVFCNRRDKRDDGVGPSAQGVADDIKTLARREKIDIHQPELVVGSRRVRERERAAGKLQELGFTAGAGGPEMPTFLVATSAGEVGIDFDADHMACDLAPWERMVQRLGRVNRRGGEGREARVVVFDTSGIEKAEAQKVRLLATRDLLGRIEADFSGAANSATLLRLRGEVDRKEMKNASTLEPLRPALTRALVDAWSMTSLEPHTGRPDVAPWLRGWLEEEFQTTVIWRTYLPVRAGVPDWPRTSAEKKGVEEFFEAAPSHESEKLETEASRVADWLQERAKALLKPRQDARGEQTADAVPPGTDVDARQGATRQVTPHATPLGGDDIALFILSRDGAYVARYTLGRLAAERKGGEQKDFISGFVGKTLVLDARLGGLNDGMLDGKRGDGVTTADTDKNWSKEAGFRVRRATPGTGEGKDCDWHFEDDFVLRANGDGDAEEWLVVEHYKSAVQSENARSVSSRPQELGQHQNQAEEKARCIGKGLGLSGVALEVLMLAARLHDEGKRADVWQIAFGATRDAQRCGFSGPLAKTTRFYPNLLHGYRHEFGSLAVFEPGHHWTRELPDDVRQRLEALRRSFEWFDLLQHLIAAHHGYARPVIGTEGCEDAPPSALEERARDVALRFARLQKRWGPWGLAWWEALLRAADQQASRDNDRGEDPGALHGEAR